MDTKGAHIRKQLSGSWGKFNFLEKQQKDDPECFMGHLEPKSHIIFVMSAIVTIIFFTYGAYGKICIKAATSKRKREQTLQNRPVTLKRYSHLTSKRAPDRLFWGMNIIFSEVQLGLIRERKGFAPIVEISQIVPLELPILHRRKHPFLLQILDQFMIIQLPRQSLPAKWLSKVQKMTNLN